MAGEDTLEDGLEDGGEKLEITGIRSNENRVVSNGHLLRVTRYQDTCYWLRTIRVNF